MTMVRVIQAGESYLSAEPLLAHFGLGAATEAAKVTVTWPSGIVDEAHRLPANQTVLFEEGVGMSIFADGFESGDVGAWSKTGPP